MVAPTHIINALSAAQWDDFRRLVAEGYLSPTGELTLKGAAQLAGVTPGPKARLALTAACPECGRTVGVYNSGSRNARRKAPRRYCEHVDRDGAKCVGSFASAEEALRG